MKRILFICIILLFLLYLLFFPQDYVKAASQGLLLWYQNILPALLPFTICSNILILSGYLDDLTRLALPLLRKILGKHFYAAYPLLAGFLFGFPMGSKISADLWKKGLLTDGEAKILCPMCNNISPAFVASYFLGANFHRPDLTALTYLFLYLPPLLLGISLLHRQPALPLQKKSASKSNLNFQMIDASIMNGFETMVKLGGYIMLFSLFVFILKRTTAGFPNLYVSGAGLLELTNGLHSLSETRFSFPRKYLHAIAMTAFGGLSGLAQTASMTKDTACSMRFYLVFKFRQTAVSVLLTLIWLAAWPNCL